MHLPRPPGSQTSELSAADGDRQNTQKELDAANAYYEKLRPTRGIFLEISWKNRIHSDPLWFFSGVFWKMSGGSMGFDWDKNEMGKMGFVVHSGLTGILLGPEFETLDPIRIPSDLLSLLGNIWQFCGNLNGILMRYELDFLGFMIG